MKGTVVGVANRERSVVLYEAEFLAREVTNPAQALWDLATGTTLVQQASALSAIALDDARVYSGGAYCGSEAECLSGADAIGGYSATTFGHTIRLSGRDVPDPGLIEHAVQHVYDAESLGGVPFYLAYGLSEAACRCYKDSFFEARAYHVGDTSAGPRGLGGEIASGAARAMGNAAKSVGQAVEYAVETIGQIAQRGVRGSLRQI